MESRPLIILVPLHYEAAVLASALELTWEKSTNSAMGSFCTFAKVQLHVIGPGAQVLPELQDEPCAIILAGLAGALDPSLQNGNVIIDSGVKISDENPIFTSARAAHLIAQTRITSTPEEKSQLFAATGAAAVDMESDVVRDFANDLGLPLIILRAISDRADEGLDAIVETFVNADGRTTPLRILLGLIRRPSLIGQLIRLQRNSTEALMRLSEVMRTLLESGFLNDLQPLD
jgi:adenosylhomocysteine nucleosidase